MSAHSPCSVRGCWSTGMFGLCDKHAAERPGPTVTIADARRSPRLRRERDEQLARWCGLAEDEIAGFVHDGELYDLRTRVLEERVALQEAEVLAAQRKALSREGYIARPPRSSVPRISAPRAA